MKRPSEMAREAGLRGASILVMASIMGSLALAAMFQNPVEEAARALSPEPGLVALDLCQKGQLEVTRVLVPVGNYYTAKRATETVRYDLTWQENGDSIAVERTRVRDFEFWSEPMSPEFKDCIRGYKVLDKEGTH